MKCKRNYDSMPDYRLKAGFNFDPVPGFQPDMAIPMGEMVRRYTLGEPVSSLLVDDEDYPLDAHYDYFDRQDMMQEMAVSESASHAADTNGDSGSSESKDADQPLGNGQASADIPGDPEIAT